MTISYYGIIVAMVYILAIFIALCLAGGQALWGLSVKSVDDSTTHSVYELLLKVIASPKFWFGVVLYVIGTGLYLILLSKAKFFSIQFGMTAVVLTFSLFVSYFIFKEQVSVLNMVGVVLILAGIFFIMRS